MNDTTTTDWAELVTRAAADGTEVLAKGAGHDWSRRAGDLDWSCRTTLDHLALGLMMYTGALTARSAHRLPALEASLAPGAPLEHCLEGLRIAATTLGLAIRAAGPDVRAWHPWGTSDGPGFGAMGIVELTVHTYDIASTFGLGWTPPDHLAAPAVARLFPGAPAGHAPGRTLLWCAGRIALPGHGRRDHCEWDGTVRAA